MLDIAGHSLRLVIHSFTPSGVEHICILIWRFTGKKIVIHSFTPSGVEHRCIDGLVPMFQCDSFVYAVRR